MFEAKEAIREKVDAIYSLLEEMQRGQVLTHNAIKEVLGIEPHQGQWDLIVHKALRRLERERGIAYWSDYLIGYRLLTEQEQLQLPGWRLQKAQRQIRKAARSVKALPEAGLSINQRKLRATQLTLLEDQERSMRRDLAEQRAIFALRQVSPRRPAQV